MSQRLHSAVLVFILLATCSPSVALAANAGAGAIDSRFPIANTPEPEMCLGMAFDGTNFLVALQGDAADHDAVGAQFVSQAGGLVGGLLSTGHLGGAPNLGWNGTDYLIVWEDCGAPCNRELWGATISTAGVVGTPFLISATYQETGGLAWGGSNYLVTYFVETNPPTTDSGVFGRLVSPAGVVGPEIAISSGLGDYSINNVAFDGTNFLVVWTNETGGTEIRGRFVSQAGTPLTEFSINSSAGLSDIPSTVLYDGGQYLVVWSDEVASGNWDLFGQRLDTMGNKLGGVISIATATGGQFGPFIARSGGGFMVTWTDGRNDSNHDFVCDPGEGTCLDIYGQLVTRSGALEGGEILISDDADNQWISVVERGGLGVFLVAAVEGGVAFEEGGDVYGWMVPDPFIFADDFETGNLIAWSNALP